MTVKEAVAVLKRAQRIDIAWDGNSFTLETNNRLQMDAYGKYVVDEILAVGDDWYELDIAMRPVKEGE